MGVLGMGPMRDTVGVMGRSVADVALMNKVLSDCPTDAPPATLAGLRVGLPSPWWGDIGAVRHPQSRIFQTPDYFPNSPFSRLLKILATTLTRCRGPL